MDINTPNLGYGKQSETTIDHANQAMRQMPFYQDYMRSIGQDPGHPTLNKQQSQQLLKLAQGQGFVVDEGHMEMDNHGNFNPVGHKLRNTLIVAGIAAAAIAAPYVIPALTSAGGAGGAAAAAGTGAGSTAATVAGVSPYIASGAIGMSTLPTIAGATAATAAGGAGSAGLWSQAARMGGSAIGKATTAAGGDRLNREELALQANRDNVSGNHTAEADLMNRSEMEARERHNALIDVARANDTRNPNIGPFDKRAPKANSPEYLASLTALEQRGLARLQADPTYSTNNMPALRSYSPLDVTNLQGATKTKPSLMERIGQYAGPAMSTYGSLYGK